MSPFRETALLPPQSRIAWIANPQISRGGADAALNGQLQTDARPSRDGSEQFGSGTQAYGPIRAKRIKKVGGKLGFWCRF